MRNLSTALYGIILLLLASCSGYEKVLKSDDVNYKLSKANEYYDKRKYQKANGLYQSLLPVMKGTKDFEALYYRYAYTSFYLEDYLASSYHFKNFTEYFPSSKDAEEAEYMHAYSLYMQSPKPSLEQTNTIKAMEAMQSYINQHPQSKRVVEANNLITTMRKKLEEKDAGGAKLYYNIGQFKASTVAYQQMMVKYPESIDADYYLYMTARSFYHYAKESIIEKQEERYGNATSIIRELKESYPSSKYLTDAEKLNTLVQNNINKLRNEHQ
jgi:outer membrane protein assembly factor BamD